MIVYVVFGSHPEYDDEDHGWINNIFLRKDQAEFMKKHLEETEDQSVVWKVIDWDTEKPLNIKGDTIQSLMGET